MEPSYTIVTPYQSKPRIVNHYYEKSNPASGF